MKISRINRIHANTVALEKQIDKLVYAFYDLTQVKIDIVERNA